jgi:hypothetical protein
MVRDEEIIQYINYIETRIPKVSLNTNPISFCATLKKFFSG